VTYKRDIQNRHTKKTHKRDKPKRHIRERYYQKNCDSDRCCTHREETYKRDKPLRHIREKYYQKNCDSDRCCIYHYHSIPSVCVRGDICGSSASFWVRHLKTKWHTKETHKRNLKGRYLWIECFLLWCRTNVTSTCRMCALCVCVRVREREWKRALRGKTCKLIALF